MSNWTFLVPHGGAPDMLAASLHSIRQHYSDEKIIVDVRGGDPYTPAARHAIFDVPNVQVIETPGHGDETDMIMCDLMAACQTDYAVYMEADCLLLKKLLPLHTFVESVGGFVGIQDFIPWPEGRPGLRINGTHFRAFKGRHSASFWMADVGRYKREIGLQAVRSTVGGEPYQGLSLSMEAAGWRINELPVTFPKDNRWAFASYYGDYVLHKWFGAWRLRLHSNLRQASGIEPEYMARTEAQLLADYWSEFSGGKRLV